MNWHIGRYWCRNDVWTWYCSVGNKKDCPEYIYSAWDQINSVLLIKYIIIIHCKCMNNGPLWNISYTVNVWIMVDYRAQPACKLERGDSGWGHDESSFWYAGPQNNIGDTDSVKILQIQHFCCKILQKRALWKHCDIFCALQKGRQQLLPPWTTIT